MSKNHEVLALNVAQIFVPMALQTAGDKKVWLPTHNPERDRGQNWATPEQTVPRDFVLSGGWDIVQGCALSHPIAALGKDWKKQVENQRVSFLSYLNLTGEHQTVYVVSNPDTTTGAEDTIKVSVSNAEVWEFLSAMYDKHPVTDWVIAGQRRSYASPWTAVLLKKLGVLDKPEDFTVYAKRIPYVDETATLDAQIRENADNIRQSFDNVGVLRNACRLLAAHPLYRQVDLANRLSLKTGSAQKAFAFASLNNYHGDDARLFERIAITPPAVGKDQTIPYKPGGYIDASRLDKEALRALTGAWREGQECPSDKVKALWGTPLRDEFAPVEVVEAYIASTFEKQKKEPTAMDRKALNKLLNCKAIKKMYGPVLTAVRDNDEAFFNALTAEK